MYRIKIVAAILARNQLYARIQRTFEPQCLEILRGDAQQQRYVVVGADLGECPGRISGRSDNQYFGIVLVDAPANRIGLGLLERTGSHVGTDGRMVAVEGDIEIFEPQRFGQTLAAVCHRSRRPRQDATYRQPVTEFVEPVTVIPHLELLLGIHRTDQRRRFALTVFEQPARIFEFVARGHTFESVLRRFKLFHIIYLDTVYIVLYIFHDIRSRKSS